MDGTSAIAVRDDAARGSNAVYSRWQAAPSSDASYDEARASALWEASVRLSGLAPGESPLVGS